MTEIALGSDLMRAGLLAIVVAILVVGCGGPDAAHYQSVLDELRIPAAWGLVHTTVRAPGAEIDCVPLSAFGCPSVARYYLVDGKPTDAYPEAKQVLTAAGFELERESGPECDLPPGDAACLVVAVRDSDLLRVSLYNPGVDTEGLGIAEQDRSLIRIVAERK